MTTPSFIQTPLVPSTAPLIYVISSPSPSSSTMTDLSAYDHIYEDLWYDEIHDNIYDYMYDDIYYDTWEPYTEDEYGYDELDNHPPRINYNIKWYFEEDFTEDVKHECFKNCDCSEIVYNDIIDYLFENKKFKRHYNAAKNYPNLRSNKIDSTTSNKDFGHYKPNTYMDARD